MNTRFIIIFLMALASLGFSESSFIWNKSSQGIYENDIRSIMVDPNNDDRIYAGTSKALYRSIDRGKTYQLILRLSGELKGVNDIYISTRFPEMLYAATDAGLYLTQNDGQSWNRIYYSSDRESQQCLSIIRHKNVVYVGTRKGLFRKTDQQTSWKKIKESFDDKPVYHSIQDEKFLYFATGQALFRLDKQTEDIQKVFTRRIGEGRREEEIYEEDFTVSADRTIQAIQVSMGHPSYLFVASSKGIYFSFDHGKEWNSLPTDNLALDDLTSILIIEHNLENNEKCLEASLGCLKLFAGTEKGVFFLNNEKWIPLYKGMETNRISYLAKDNRRTVYAATAKGIYFFPTEEALPSFDKIHESNVITGTNGAFCFNHEPGINEVHQLAIDYAEVNHEKISNWRILARKKALLPDLSVGLDRSATDLFHWDTGSSPDKLQRGRDFIDWDVSMSWDLSDLVWSTDQTTIDSRSKLMVELREDILDEVTRLYFERRRIQTELVIDHALDPRLKIDQEMRIAELTALIDALTGGEFSKKIIKN